MNPLIERLAREATTPIKVRQSEATGQPTIMGGGLNLEVFAALVAQECARVAAETPTALLPSGSFLSERCAARIRAAFPMPKE
jgi:hypothetical protein